MSPHIQVVVQFIGQLAAANDAAETNITRRVRQSSVSARTTSKIKGVFSASVTEGGVSRSAADVKSGSISSAQTRRRSVADGVSVSSTVHQ